MILRFVCPSRPHNTTLAHIDLGLKKLFHPKVPKGILDNHRGSTKSFYLVFRTESKLAIRAENATQTVRKMMKEAMEQLIEVVMPYS